MLTLIVSQLASLHCARDDKPLFAAKREKKLNTVTKCLSLPIKGSNVTYL